MRIPRNPNYAHAHGPRIKSFCAPDYAHVYILKSHFKNLTPNPCESADIQYVLIIMHTNMNDIFLVIFIGQLNILTHKVAHQIVISSSRS